MLEKLNPNSIRFRVTAAVVGIAVLLVAILLACNLSSAGMVRSQVYTTYQTILATYIHGLENNMEDVEGYLASRLADTTDLRLIRRHGSDWSLAAAREQEDLGEAILSYNMADGLFIYEPKYDIWVDATVPNYNNAHRLAVRRYITENISEGDTFQRLRLWGTAQVGEEYVFFRILKVQGCYLGAWVRASTITEDFTMGEISHSGYVTLCGEAGERYHNIAQLRDLQFDPLKAAQEYQLADEFMVAAQKSEKMNAYLVVLVKDDSILEGMDTLQLLLTILTICAVLAVGGVVLTTYYYLVNPLNRLTRAMQSFQSGNWNIRLPEESELDEFAGINATFNHMVEQVEELKIDVYEQKLEKQVIENQMLKQQMAPHTFINCLNTMHGLAGTGKTELIQQMAEDLGKHLRYVLSMNQTVQFRQELEHARNYISICRIRYGNGICLEEQIDEEVLSAFVPPLILYAFVENSIKYAMNPERETHIWVRARREGDTLCLRLRDNGNGYSEEMLRRLSAVQAVPADRSGHQIGLRNLRRRTVLLYGEKHVSIRFSNVPEGGAQMDIVIPFQTSGVRNG